MNTVSCIWQDFILLVPLIRRILAFLKRVEAEADYNIKRLRNHASLAMWCGNNEIYEGMRYWGWDKKYTDPAITEGMKRGYDKLFRELLPRKVQELDPDRFLYAWLSLRSQLGASGKLEDSRQP